MPRAFARFHILEDDKTARKNARAPARLVLRETPGCSTSGEASEWRSFDIAASSGNTTVLPILSYAK